ncbi:FMN-binding glutamate synthase family protein [Paenibacillus thalictri]|uniref:FMN-binding glutamate synthase family protein n=1 Tax=Paenibacillus thalictri TaxID=2527873 RepID=A0A4Q9DYA3_9BACL|nr:FMN-binding glutamate synthase family protein [Paenibacillus thalictri]TBL81375.1 FMN-binding glutamate synthase family protein [Paenibacillus thalictri]
MTFIDVLGIIAAFIVIAVAALLLQLFIISRRPQHSIIRSHPFLGWVRYLLEKLGPEFRQYWFDDDADGKPFSRYDYVGLVFSAKYRTDLIGFGSKRDFDKPGFYIANAMFPLLSDQLSVAQEENVKSKKYQIEREGLFSRTERMIDDTTPRWLYNETDAVIVGKNRRHPWKLQGMFGASATSYGAIGENYILSTGQGAALAGGSWINTGEGGVVPEHLASGADVVAQIGPGLFGYRDEKGQFSKEQFALYAAEDHVKAFELKFAQGAKIRGGHLEGSKVTAKIAAIRKVPIGQTVNSPNRFAFLDNAEHTLAFVREMQELGGKPVGLKIVIGQQDELERLMEAMVRLDIYPDFITVDGSEGGSGATYKSMADTMGMPLIPALITFIDTAHKFGVRDQFAVFASGKLISPDKVAIALAIGADAVNSARGFMMANGCIMALQCHTGKCPSGIATTHPKYQDALVPAEKQWRVMNYIISMRYGLYSLAAAAGLDSPRKFTREHIQFINEFGAARKLSDLFPIPAPYLQRKQGTVRPEQQPHLGAEQSGLSL